MSALFETVKERLGARLLAADEPLGEPTFRVAPADWLETNRLLRTELAFDALLDLTAVDYLGREPRYEVVAHLGTFSGGKLIRMKTGISGEPPRVASLACVWRAANWLEREAYDMFGIRFEGHPDLRRILMYEEFEGYPLRKDYPVMKRQPLIPERDPVENPWPARDRAIGGKG